MKLKNILFGEAAGDPLGGGTEFPDAGYSNPSGYGFQGSGKAWATGQTSQNKGMWNKLIDPEEEKERRVFGSLDKEENSPQPLEEREASDILYRDLIGVPPMNSLSLPINHIPPDVEAIENDVEPNDMSMVSITTLIPFPKLEKFGYGPLTPTKPKFESANKWDETTGENIPNIRQDGKYDILVAPRDWTSMEELDPSYGFNRLNDEDDVNTRPGDMANLVSPKKHIPGPAPVYEENKKMKAKESKKLNDLEKKKDYIPADKEEKKPKTTVGTGVGSVLQNDKAPPKNMKNESKKETKMFPEKPAKLDAHERLQPYKGSSEVLTSPEDFTVVMEAIKETVKEVMSSMMTQPQTGTQPKVGSQGKAVEKKLSLIPGLENLLAAVKGKGDAGVILSQIATALGGDKLRGSDALKKALQISLSSEKEE